MDRIGNSLNDFDFMKENVQVVLATLATLARPPRILIRHEQLADQADTLQPYALTAEILSPSALVQDSLLAHYRVDGGEFSTAPLRPERRAGSTRFCSRPSTAGRGSSTT